MNCQNCVRHVTEAIQSVPGVRRPPFRSQTRPRQWTGIQARLQMLPPSSKPSKGPVTKRRNGCRAESRDAESRTWAKARSGHCELWLGGARGIFAPISGRIRQEAAPAIKSHCDKSASQRYELPELRAARGRSHPSRARCPQRVGVAGNRMRHGALERKRPGKCPRRPVRHHRRRLRSQAG